MNGFTLVEVSQYQYSAASGAPREYRDKAGVDIIGRNIVNASLDRMHSGSWGVCPHAQTA